MLLRYLAKYELLTSLIRIIKAMQEKAVFTPNPVAATNTLHFSFDVKGNRCGTAATVSDTSSVITNPELSVHYAIYNTDWSMGNLENITEYQQEHLRMN